jgi:predicted PurR-regulated permease PerM
MIQINLLPEVKAQYLKARRVRALITSVSLLAVIVSGVIMVIGAVVTLGVQRAQLTSTQTSIDDSLAKLNSTKDLDKILTVQNQVNSLSALHEAKPVLSRLFSYSADSQGYLWKLMPSTLKVTQLDIKTGEAPTFTISGTADRPDQVNRFVDVLKFTEFKESPESSETKRVFSSVVLQSFGVGTAVRYTINASFDPAIFSAGGSSSIIVPENKETTRSITERPQFDPAPAPQGTPQTPAAGGTR